MEKVLIARAPVRINFGGGGTDLPSYYERHGGLTINATISYYVYTILTSNQLDEVQVIYADHQPTFRPSERQDLIWNTDLGLPRAIAHHFSIRNGLTIFLASQVPPGTGLGLSGSVAVSMIKAIALGSGLDLGPEQVAELASYIEIDKMKMPVGKQDQYAAAFGGLNAITFTKDRVIVEPLNLLPETRVALEGNLMLFFSGLSSSSSTILHRQREAIQRGEPDLLRRLAGLKELAVKMRVALEGSDLDSFGDLLHRSWMEKRQLVQGISTPALDRCYQVAREKGVLGGKVTGAGGGGCLLLYCPREHQDAVATAMGELGLERWPFTLEEDGVQIMQLMPWSRQQVMATVPWTQQPVSSSSPFVVSSTM